MNSLDALPLIREFLEQQKDFGVREVVIPQRQGSTASKAKQLEDLHGWAQDCLKCSLGKTRTNFVFGTGNPDAELMFIGEAPGHDEDLQGKPFVGAAGQLLSKMIEAMGLTRDQVYIANILKCRPPNNRDPLPEESQACLPVLRQQIAIIQPRFICALGRIAAQTLLNTVDPLAKLRGRFMEYEGRKMIVTYHPAALLRNPNWKRPAWEDLQLLMKEMNGR